MLIHRAALTSGFDFNAALMDYLVYWYLNVAWKGCGSLVDLCLGVRTLWAEASVKCWEYAVALAFISLSLS